MHLSSTWRFTSTAQSFALATCCRGPSRLLRAGLAFTLQSQACAGQALHFELVDEQTLSCPRKARPSLPLDAGALLQRAPLEHRRRAVKDKDGPDTMKKQLADPAQHAKQMSIPQHITLRIPHRLDELGQPNAHVHREASPRQRGHRDPLPNRPQQLPQTLNAHLSLVRSPTELPAPRLGGYPGERCARRLDRVAWPGGRWQRTRAVQQG